MDGYLVEFSNGQAPTEDFLKKGNKAVAKLVKILQVCHVGTDKGLSLLCYLPDQPMVQGQPHNCQ